MKVNIALLIGIVYLLLLAGYLFTKIGEQSPSVLVNYTIFCGLVLASIVPFLLGFIAGKIDKNS